MMNRMCSPIEPY